MKTRQDTITTDFQKASISVSDLTNELAVVSDALEDVKVRLCWFQCSLWSLVFIVFHVLIPLDTNRVPRQLHDRHFPLGEDQGGTGRFEV
jgi:hypothetical protein